MLDKPKLVSLGAYFLLGIHLFQCTSSDYQLISTNVEFDFPGTVMLIGGENFHLRREISDDIYKEFIDLAGGINSTIVLIPSAHPLSSTGSSSKINPNWKAYKTFKRLGAINLIVRDTWDRNVADSPDFADAISSAKGIWIDGGFEWRLQKTFLNTLTHEALSIVLENGGIIAGNSAGGALLGSFVMRGGYDEREFLVGDSEGFGLIKNIAVDSHMNSQHRIGVIGETDKIHRLHDLKVAIEKRPNLLGIGLDDNSAVIIQGKSLHVFGPRPVYIYDDELLDRPDQNPYMQLANGATYSITTFERIK